MRGRDQGRTFGEAIGWRVLEREDGGMRGEREGGRERAIQNEVKETYWS